MEEESDNNKVVEDPAFTRGEADKIEKAIFRALIKVYVGDPVICPIPAVDSKPVREEARKLLRDKGYILEFFYSATKWFAKITPGPIP